MTRKLSDTLEEYTPTLEQEVIATSDNEKGTSQGLNQDSLMEALKDFQSDDDNDTADEYCTVFEVFDYQQGFGLAQIPVELYPLSPMTFHGSEEKAVLLSPTQDRQYISVRPSNQEVYELIVSELTDLNHETHCIETIGAFHRGLLEYCLYFLHKSGVRIFMTKECIEEYEGMEVADYLCYIKSPITRKSRGNSYIIDSLSPLIRSNYGGVGFILTDDNNPNGGDKINIREYVLEYDRKISMILQHCNYLIFGFKYTLIILPDELRADGLKHYFEQNRKCLDCTVTYADKADCMLATGKFERVIILDLMDPKILDMLEDEDVANAIRKMDIVYGIAYGGSVVQAPEPVFYELQKILGCPIRLAL